MKCLRCGYCCIKYDVIIVNNPDLGIVDGNLIHKSCTEKCPHLKGNTPGKYSCKIHGEIWYKETPCYSHGQIENSVNDPCRMGSYILNNNQRILQLAST